MGKRGIIAAVFMSLLFFFAFLAGCEEQEQVGTRRLRLLADENHRLKQELAERDNRIKEKNKLLAELEKKKTVAVEETDKMIMSMMDMMQDFEEKSASLTKENEQLKAKINELAKQIESLKTGR